MAVASGRRRTRRRRSEPTTRASKVMTLTSRRVPLASLAPAVRGEVRGDAGTMVTDVVLDTRKVVPGALFCCVPGARFDGHDLAGKALDAGAAALCVQRPLDLEAPQLLVGGVRDVLAPLAAAFFDHPSRRFDLVGVTGTNGKTTTTFMLEAIFRAAGLLPGCWAPSRCGSATPAGRRSTPPPRRPTSSGCWPRWPTPACGRRRWRCPATAWPCTGSTAPASRRPCFTNLTQDHLDFHTDLDDYYRAKRRLFTPEFTSLGVVNVDDPHGRAARRDGRGGHRHHRHRRRRRLAGHRRRRLAGGDQLPGPLARRVADRPAAAGRVLQRGQRPGRPGRGRRRRHRPGHRRGRAGGPGRGARPLRAGRRRPAVHRAGRLRPHPRLPRQPAPGGPGGHRRPGDRGLRLRRRPRPGQAAADGRDRRAAGRRGRGHLRQPPLRGPGGDRRPGGRGHRPRRRAGRVPGRGRPAGRPSGPPLALAGPGDAVVVAGKGHEQGQEFAGGRKVPFDDRVVAAEELRALLGAAR